MAKINITNNNMAMFMVCEAIGTERKEWKDLHPDENGLYDITILLNGKEINAERFMEALNRSYQGAVREQAASLLSAEYDKILHSVYEIQESLEQHNKLFDEKVFPYLSKEREESSDEKAY
jgi:hypothetical protein